MNNKFLLACLASAAVFTFAIPAIAADSAQDFVNKAAMGGMLEVESSKLIMGKGNDVSVKDFAAMMITDHGAANSKLVKIGGEQKLSVPTMLDEAHRSELDKLTTAGAPLDEAYVEMQREAHSDAVTFFESYAKDGDNPSLKAFAQETVPALKMHKDAIEKIAATLSTQPATDNANTGASNSSEPMPGANSFTEAQAKGRIEEAGFSGVKQIIKDDNGIWRGQATKDGKSVLVALDYQGNVFANAK